MLIKTWDGMRVLNLDHIQYFEAQEGFEEDSKRPMNAVMRNGEIVCISKTNGRASLQELLNAYGADISYVTFQPKKGQRTKATEMYEGNDEPR